MTWQKGRRYRRGNAWQMYGPLMAMMAAGGKWNADWGDWSGDWGGGPGGSGRRRRRGRMFGQGELRLALLALIAEEPRHGYELIKAIEEMTGGQYAPSPGAVYPTLQLLEDEGKITPAKPKGKGKDKDADSGKKPFEATKDGKAELEERASEVESLMDRLNEHGERAEKVRSPDLFRAMGNLANVLKNRARAGTLDKAVMDEIVDIIDEVAKRIERI
ncbi:PadR family transcriptional regulator [Erythrobacter sp. JK5]|uniref:PadR family transcriptional regulator n=1 Tax=Erythrobacter sp. JK5 TaxID=2829500 RepID=UPI0020119665|nr:PadR family transcriptional regulator [Erythrobacter sp. JK5]